MIRHDEPDVLRCHARYQHDSPLLYCTRPARHRGDHRAVRIGQPGAHAVTQWSDA